MNASLIRRLMAAAVSLGALSAAHADMWTSTGSTGTLDEATAATDVAPAKVTLSGPYVMLTNATAQSSGVVRYNVTDLFGYTSFTPYFEMRFLDTSATTRVQAQLRAYNVVTGANRLVASLDSNSVASSSAYQRIWTCGTSMSYANEVYYIEATLSRTATTGSAALAALRVGEECLL
ncbi:MAG: hypothetical protein ACOZJX_11200 [Pseudomonadota bacterium]